MFMSESNYDVSRYDVYRYDMIDMMLDMMFMSESNNTKCFSKDGSAISFQSVPVVHMLCANIPVGLSALKMKYIEDSN